MSRAHGARSVLAVAFESTYGTAPASGFKQVPFARSTLGTSQPLLNSELLGFGRDPVAPVRDAITADGQVEVPIDAEAFGFWLKGALGSPTTTGTGAYTHVYETGGWTLPSFAAETQLPEVPHFALMEGCVVNTLSWTMQRSGLLTASVGVIAQGEDVQTSTQAGTLTSYTLQRFGHFQGAITRDTVALGDVVEASISYTNNLDRIETIRSDGKIDGVDPGMAACSGRLVARFANQTLLTAAKNGTASAFEFEYTHVGGETLTIAVPVAYLPVPRVEVPGPQGIQATFEWQASQQANGDPMMTVTLVNDVSAY